MSGPRIAVVAGEASGDLIAAESFARLDAVLPRPPVLAGIAGQRMQAAGVQPWWPSEWLAVNGYAAVLAALPRLVMVHHRLIRRTARWPADLFVGIDAPDFNLGVEERLRAQGIRTVHFVSPSIWAWRGERIEKIRRAVGRMLLVFPFEKALYDAAGVPATYVGHPLADRVPMQPDAAAARATLGLGAPGRPTVIGVLPGSRRGEIELIAPTFFDTAERLARDHPDWVFLVPAAGAERFRQLQQMLLRRRARADIRLVSGQSHLVLAACDAALVASGTATLEAALFKRPMVIAYKVAPLTYRMMRFRGYLPYVGLPNILAGRFVVPELLQDFARPALLAEALLQQVHDTARADRTRAVFTGIHESLRQGCAQRVADAIGEVLDEPAPPRRRRWR